jgi:hypothetical protein
MVGRMGFSAREREMIAVVEIVVGLLIYTAIAKWRKKQEEKTGGSTIRGGTLSKLGATPLAVLTLTCFDSDRARMVPGAGIACNSHGLRPSISFRIALAA